MNEKQIQKDEALTVQDKINMVADELLDLREKIDELLVELNNIR
jgi:hypothetical protein